MPGWWTSYQIHRDNWTKMKKPRSIPAAESFLKTVQIVGGHRKSNDVININEMAEFQNFVDDIQDHIEYLRSLRPRTYSEGSTKDSDFLQSSNLGSWSDSESQQSTNGSSIACSDHNTFLQNLPKIVQNELRTEEDDKVLADCLVALKSLVGEELQGNWRVEPFGSAANGFGTHRSDIDVVMYEPDQQSDARVILKQFLPILRNSKLFWVRKHLLGDKVRVPILKLCYVIDGHLKKEVDLSSSSCGALDNTRLLQRYSSIDARVAQLGVAVKLWAEREGVCGAAMGFLSSYALTLMAVYFLQVKVGLPCLFLQADLQHGREEWESKKTLASLIKEFFDFYADEFIWGKEVVSIRIGRQGFADGSEFQALDKEHGLHIEDPYIKTRNLGDVLTSKGEVEFRQAIKKADQTLQSIATSHTSKQ